ncbi:MAG: tRNA (adenosine(37)-N6)-dimethylallyltransferase MiaA [Minisyncoccia bacterium]
MKPKILVILGPTATGKSDLAVEVALKYNGEIISADSRQVYKGMNLGTGKITKKEMRGVPHYMLDIVNPSSVYNVAKYKAKADKIIADIIKRKKIPIICGGTGFYIDYVVKNITLPDVPPNQKLRNKLEKESCEKLMELLIKLDPRISKIIDSKNKVKIIRAIEIAKKLGKVPEIKSSPIYNAIKIGLIAPDKVLKERIKKRLIKRIELGMLKEGERLHKQGLSWKRMESLGLEYRYMARHLSGKISLEQMICELNSKIWQYARRQKTWFKGNKEIKWYEVSPKTNQKIISYLLRK